MSHATESHARIKAVRTVIKRTPRKIDFPVDAKGQTLKISEYFGSSTFSLEKMKERLPKTAFEKFRSAMEHGNKIDLDTANVIAKAVKEWAMDQGATHFCHWFQPQTGLTAEKHDAFLSFDEANQPVEKFSGSQLVQSEPDASSFPSGGMRTTFEARGYTVWDPSSPMFIMDSTNGRTLCIPSAFISYHGHALDKKTALLRSIEALSKNACELLHLIGMKDAKRVVPSLGCEQEYFLIDRAFVGLRPDLIMASRTLVGGQPPKGQQLEDHYFGSIPSRAAAFMAELEMELYKLGVPIKTRHNEVAPGQFETAPIFEEANVAIDHNQLVMEMLKKVARRHSFEALLHEKPFAGINGSGKHNNWSMMITGSPASVQGTNLLDPGTTPHQNLRFLLFLVATLKGVHRHAGLLRAAIATAGNDHRLGANEAPPAIISVFLGDMLSRVLDQIEKGGTEAGAVADAVLKLGVSKLPDVMKDNTDRNRTSPFAFTGNKFEFRAVGSSASPALPITFLNAAVAEALGELTASLKKKMDSKKNLEAAALEVLQDAVKETKAIRFEGNNYSDEWQKEAARRGLPNFKKAPEALKAMLDPKAQTLLVGMGILSESELKSRYVIRLERYIKDILIEADTLKAIVDTQILPASFGYFNFLAEGMNTAKNAGLGTPQRETAGRLEKAIQALVAKRESFTHQMDKVESTHDEEQKGKLLSTEVVESMSEIRKLCDELEGLVGDGYWPLPKYREMLFIS